MAESTGLAPEFRRALDRLSRLPELRGYYLAGGTAVAMHLGHRQSLDLDFFSLDSKPTPRWSHPPLRLTAFSLRGFSIWRP
jgi:hypothetical protein